MNETPSPSQQRPLTTLILISLLIGGLMGGLVGAVTGGIASDRIVPWFDKTFLGKTDQASTSETGKVDSASQTVQVKEESETSRAVKKVLPSVGSIIVKQDLSKLSNTTNPSPLDWFFGYPSTVPQGKQQVAAGTGFIVSTDGYILTNKHVVNVEAGEYTFITNDGKQYDARLVGSDPFNDLAVLKIDASGLPAVELGDSDSLELGQTVIAIGNTLDQFPNTVTKGIVSGNGRTITAGDGQGQSETIEKVIQTDAAINRGNSGGPLINLSGQVVGINTAVSQEGQLIGFAIPVNLAKPVIESVQKQGRVIRPYLGVRYRLIDADFAKQNSLSVDYGALIIRGQAQELAIVPGSPADKAGLEENDIILEINGQKIDSDNTLASMMKQFKVGESITLKVLHDDGSEKNVTVTLEEYKPSE